MHQLYRLLRNNKETGPFSLEELVANDLCTSDLVWVEGKSIYWKNPFEIEELAPAPKITEKDSEPDEYGGGDERPYHAAALSYNSGSEDRRSGEADPLSLNEDSQVIFHPSVNEVFFTPDVKDPSEEIQLYPELNRNGKQLYPETSWEYVPVKKRKRHSQVLPILFIGGLIITAAFLFFSNSVSTKNNEVNKVADESVENKTATNNNRHPQVPELNQAGGELNHLIANNTTHHPEATLKSGSPVSHHTETETAKLHVQMKHGITTQTTNEIQRVQIPEAGPLVQKEHSSSSIIESGNNPDQQVFSLYGIHPVKHQQGVPAFKLTITNNSDVLRFAAVDVFYKKNGQLTNKETLYFKNVAPHQSVTLTAPANQAADDVSYKLGLVSNENGEIYVGN